MSAFRKGDRVEACDSGWRGTVTKVIKKDVFVELDDKFGGEIKKFADYNVYPSDSISEDDDSALEIEFTELVKDKSSQIKEKFDAAQKLLEEAISMCEKEGIPVETKAIGSRFYGYVPRTFERKFKAVHPLVVEQLTGLQVGNSEYGLTTGWLSSSSYC